MEATISASDDGNRSPFSIGSIVKGFRFEYKVLRELGKGGRGHAFVVQAIHEAGKSTPTGECVLKTVRIDKRRSPDEVFSFAAKVHGLLVREFRALLRLSRLDCVPNVYDFGVLGFDLNADETVPLTFLVREQVNGLQLHRFLETTYASARDGAQFTGIPLADDWFIWARKISAALLQIQQLEVVHRDIWHENILVDGDAIRFIDFGDAYLRQERATESANDRSDPFVAPEVRIGSRWPSRRADIYSMGGVLFYMATGQAPPNPPIDDDEVLKREIFGSIDRMNPKLLAENHGIADIVARCLRSDHHRRIKDAEMLLGDLNVFDSTRKHLTLASALKRLGEQLDRNANLVLDSVFSEIAAVELNHLSNVIDGMKFGAVDINGDHEQLASGFVQYLSVLEKGDEYLSVSTAEFWAPDNAGVNGRVLAMNRILAQRGVKIRRLFLVTPDEIADNSSLFKRVSVEHLRKRHGLPDDAVWDSFVKIIDPARKAEAIDFFEHYGVWIKDGHAVRILPVYTRTGNNERILRALRIRKYDGDVQIIREEFEKQLENVRRLSEVVSAS